MPRQFLDLSARGRSGTEWDNKAVQTMRIPLCSILMFDLHVSEKNEMKTDFKISQAIYLVSGGHELDLHNFYDFQEVFYSVVGRKVFLRWKRSKREGVDSSLPVSVEISFLKVSRFQFLPRDSDWLHAFAFMSRAMILIKAEEAHTEIDR